MPGPLNYTTTVAVDRTVAEVHTLLAQAGVSAVATNYADGEPVAVTFVPIRGEAQLPYRLPVDVQAMHRHLVAAEKRGDFPKGRKFATEKRAARVAWRVVKDWLAAQLALVETGQADAEQVMLPYLQVQEGYTMYQLWRSRSPELTA